MHLTTFLLPLIAASPIYALPTATVDEPATLSARQAVGQYSSTWNDPYIAKPQNFFATTAGSRCEYQLAYERSSVDNRYDVFYYAEYTDGTSAQINGLSGSLPRDNVWRVEGYTESRGAQVVFFPNACKYNGTVTPNAIRAYFSLRPGFTYENKYTSGSITFANASLPSAPTNVQVKAAAKSSTVTWNAVAGASAYVVLVEWYVDSEAGPLPFVWAREVTNATSFTYNRRFTRAAVVAVAGGTISQGTKRFTPLDDVSDVRPN